MLQGDVVIHFWNHLWWRQSDVRIVYVQFIVYMYEYIRKMTVGSSYQKGETNETNPQNPAVFIAENVNLNPKTFHY